MVQAATRSQVTLLKALVHERHLTVSETLEALERRAERMEERAYALSERQLRRWLAGDVSSLGGTRPANVRVAEAEFCAPISSLLAPDERGSARALPSREPDSDRGLATSEFVGWIAEHSSIEFETAYAAVEQRAAEIAAVPAARRASSDHGRRQVARAELADTITKYYDDAAGFYCAEVGPTIVRLSVVADPTWLGLALPLRNELERCRLVSPHPVSQIRLNDLQAEAAIERLSAVEIAGTVMVNNPLYSLVGLEINEYLAAQFVLRDFASYALTVDLLKEELRRLLGDGVQDRRTMATPLRDAWLPTLDFARTLGERACLGGPVCLVAIADGDQYHLLVQERSSKVLNVTGTLAVIPKAFHQPSIDPYGETRISTTLERELEEELFGRPDLDQLAFDSARRAAPLHPRNASPPMAWLHRHSSAWQMECTAVGINMVSGNYEIACLVVVHDPTWWDRFGHLLEANWEAKRLHRYSSLDHDGITALVGDPRWSNEGLFAFLEGLRRLHALDPARVLIPRIGVRS